MECELEKSERESESESALENEDMKSYRLGEEPMK